MADHGTGAGKGAAGSDFEALAREYWGRWGEMLRAGAEAAAGQVSGQGGAAASGFPGNAFAGLGGTPWAGGVPGLAGFPGAWMPGLTAGAFPGAGFGAAAPEGWLQAGRWQAMMQEVAARFAGRPADPAAIAAAWKQALGGDAANPFADMLAAMQGPGQQGFDPWLAQVGPWVGKLHQAAQEWLGAPAFGFTREHQERWQHLAQVQLDYQQHSQAYRGLMAEAAQDAFRRFEVRLAEHSEPGRQLESARALFDLWIDAAEDAYAEVALSPRFRDAYGLLVNAQMRLRAAMQGEIEQFGHMLGVPTRTEVDAAHRKIVQLEREVRRLRDRTQGPGGDDAHVAAAEAGQGVTPAPVASGRPAAAPPARKPAAARAAAKAAAVTRAGSGKAATERGAAKKTAAKATTKKTTTKVATNPPARARAARKSTTRAR